MNREEAIKHLETYSTINGSGQTTQAQHEEAKRMAIKALEQQPTKEEMALLQKWRDNRGISMEEFEDAMNSLEQETCGNAIDRAEAIKVASGYCHPSNVAKELAKLPPINLQSKTGHWEQYGNSWEDKFKCSECGKQQPKILCGERIIGHWSDYCPNCGCRMVEPQERSDKV